MQLQLHKPLQLKQQPQAQPSYLQQFMAHQNSKLKISEEYLFLKVVMGKYFIQAYRVFKMLPKDNSIVFWKRQQNRTNYHFFIIFESEEELKNQLRQLKNQEKDRVKEMKQSVQKLTRKDLQTYSISLALVQQLKKINFQNLTTYYTFLHSLNYSPANTIPNQGLSCSQSPLEQRLDAPFTVESFMPSLKKEDEDLLFESKRQFESLKELMSVYMDTFASEEKGRKIYREIDKSSGSFSVDLLLNTLNYIIFLELNNTCYSQIEPCYWTCFESSTKQLNSDRKHIVLTGSGQICVLEIIFLKDHESQNKTEYSMMLTEFKKFYKKAIIKSYRILNEKWNGEVEKIDLEEEPIKGCSAPAIIYKFDCSKNIYEYTAQVSK